MASPPPGVQRLGDALACRAEHPRAGRIAQGVDAADVVRVVMRD